MSLQMQDKAEAEVRAFLELYGAGLTEEAPDWLVPRSRASCRVPDDQMSYRSYPLLAARELLKQFIREQVHGHQAA